MAKMKNESVHMDVETLQAENAALKAREDQILDALITLQEQVAAMQAQGPAVSAVPQINEEEAKLDAELAALKEEFADYPLIDVFERRALEGAEANNDIRLLDEPGLQDDPRGQRRKWVLRWFNLGVEGRADRAKIEGYEKVRWVDLRSAESIPSSLESKDDFVRRGDKGAEVLHRIPKKLYEYKKKRDAARVRGILTSETKLRDHIAGGVAALAGHAGQNADQAGSFVHNRGGFEVTIEKGERETVTF